MLYKLCFFAPTDAVEKVKEAVFAAGGGRIGSYDRCCWQTEGVGQFRPLPGSSPHVGDVGKTVRVPETKVEMVCDGAQLRNALDALIRAHPYETPAFEYWAVNQPRPE